jgi:antitoxin VapB
MALSIKNRETEELARALAEAEGSSITRAVTVALREALLRRQGRPTPKDKRAMLLAIARECAALPVLDDRPMDEILGYDDDGLFG